MLTIRNSALGKTFGVLDSRNFSIFLGHERKIWLAARMGHGPTREHTIPKVGMQPEVTPGSTTDGRDHGL